MSAPPRLELHSTIAGGVTYSFKTSGPWVSWALCTVNDATGELLITSDWGNWSHRWNTDPRSLGHPTLTAFIGERGDVDYLARKLQREGRGGLAFSAGATVKELRRLLCERRLEDGRERLENRLDPEEDMPGGVPLSHLSGRYDENGLPIISHRMPAGYRSGRPWDIHGDHYKPLMYLDRDVARRIWDQLGELADEVGTSCDLFFERIQHIDGVSDYITDEPWHHIATEQTPEDRALRDIVLPALIESCAKTCSERSP